MEAYGKWFLGVDANADPKTKQHWHYIYTSDFKNVDRSALIAKTKSWTTKANRCF